MDWDAIGAVGEIAGALAVVATLVYLAQQTRNSQKATVAATQSATYLASVDHNLRIAQNPESLRIWLKSYDAERSEFDDLEWAHFCQVARATTVLIADGCQQSLNDALDPESGEIVLGGFAELLKFPAWKEFWAQETKGHNYRQSFVDAINNQAKSGSSGGATWNPRG